MRSKGRLGAVIISGLTAVIAIVVVIVLGFVGVNVSATSGTQTQVCGVTLGINASDDTVRLLGASDRTLVPGDRVRVAPLCVVEVVSIDGDVDSDLDGDGPVVQLRWRLW